MKVVDFGQVEVYPFEVLLLVLQFSGDYFVDVFGFGWLFHFGRSQVLLVGVALFVEGFSDGCETFF